MTEKITFSIIKADVGSYPGHHVVHPELMKVADKHLKEAKNKGKIIDFFVTNCGDDLELIMTHRHGEDNEDIHTIAWDTFLAATEKAKQMKLYGAGQDILSDAFSGNVKGMGPGVAELEFEERKSDPVIAFLMDKTEPGAFNLPLYRIFADPFCTAGLVIDESMHDGFIFHVFDVKEAKTVELKTPEEIYDVLALIGTTGRYVIKKIETKTKIPAAACSTSRLSLIAGKYVGKDDPVAVVRSQSGLPAVGEVLEGFAFPHMVAGWMRGSHHGPMMPVGVKNAKCTRFDGPPRVVGLGFQLANGKLIGPADLFDDPAFDITRQKAGEIADYFRRQGPFEPSRLGPEELEYTTLAKVLKKLKDRFVEG
jgi:fructose 1,6-bisphosphate aldolase/phosphatase